MEASLGARLELLGLLPQCLYRLRRGRDVVRAETPSLVPPVGARRPAQSWAEAAPWRAECAGRVEDVTSESFAGQGTYTLTATDLDLNAA